MPQYQTISRWNVAIAVALMAVVQTVSAEDPATILPPPAGLDAPVEIEAESAIDLEKVHEGTKYVGTMSCAAASCHGAGFSEPDRVYRAYDIWRTKDPHAKAYQVLFNDVSVNMGKLLGLKTPPHLNETCLACHGNPPGHFEKSKKNDFVNTASPTNGVGCEACHGPAKNWLNEHRAYNWNSMSEKDKAKTGWVNLEKLTDRAKVCADCHVGGPGKDVNHDLIGAGHPRLNFEFSAYMSKYASGAAHWSVNEDYARHQGENGSTYEAKLWMTGQIVSARASAALLKQRAESKSAPWPEFSEYSCYACHHDLSQPSFAGPNWRQDRAKERKSVVAFPYNNWNHALAAKAVESLSGQEAAMEMKSAMEKLQMEMEKFGSDRGKVASMAAGLEAGLSKRMMELDGISVTPAQSRVIVNGLTSNQMVTQIKDWDRATQSYLALIALKNSMDGEPDGFKSNLLDIRGNLNFPSKDTKEFSTIRFNSPKWDTNENLISIRAKLLDINEISK